MLNTHTDKVASSYEELCKIPASRGDYAKVVNRYGTTIYIYDGTTYLEVVDPIERDRQLAAIVRKYFTSGNAMQVERATILRKDIEHWL
jgi:predicted ATPase